MESCVSSTKSPPSSPHHIRKKATRSTSFHHPSQLKQIKEKPDNIIVLPKKIIPLFPKESKHKKSLSSDSREDQEFSTTSSESDSEKKYNPRLKKIDEESSL
eukprot:TRINITY_DN9641_c0_g2_i1.p1 TRINITY_DN9641_c0_g2~~TRINITY_DN9641_c0_g2_i1.p1  ORF type:complete len:102 (+),score=6.29 TRINITY_DN9641_c0_g2_i1:193-498(+)